MVVFNVWDIEDLCKVLKLLDKEEDVYYEVSNKDEFYKIKLTIFCDDKEKLEVISDEIFKIVVPF